MSHIAKFILYLLLLVLMLQGAVTCFALELDYPVSPYTPGSYNGRSFFFTEKPAAYHDGYEGHLGEDINLPEGAAIRAIADGKIVQYEKHDGYGTLAVVIEHDLGSTVDLNFKVGNEKKVSIRKFCSIYGHLRRSKDSDGEGDLNLSVSKWVSKGDVIGYVQNGDFNGDGGEHLHMGIHIGPHTSWKYFGYCNPAKYPDSDVSNFVAFSELITLLHTTVKTTIVNDNKETTIAETDLSGRWAGECSSDNDQQHYNDKVSILEADGKVYSVIQRKDSSNSDYIVWADDADRANYFGESYNSPASKLASERSIIEKRGNWIFADRSSRKLSSDGNTIYNHAEFDKYYGAKTIQDGSWNRIASLNKIPPLSNLMLKQQGMVKKGEEVTGGNLKWSKEKQYLLVYLNYPGSKLELIAIRPDGTIVTADSPGVKYFADEIPARLYIENPQEGNWKFKVRGIEMDGAKEPFWVLAAPSDIGPAGASMGGGGISSGTDWQMVVFMVSMVGIIIFGGLCLVVLMRQRATPPTATAPPIYGWLQVHSPGIPVYNTPITESNWLIGRAPFCQTVLADSKVSAQHAIVQHNNAGAILADAGSANGILHNTDRINGSVMLQHGDRIQLGSTVLIYFFA